MARLKTFRPMLAEDAIPEELRFPLMASKKYDGCRALSMEGLGLVSRRLKPIPNRRLNERFGEHTPFLDGELVWGTPNDEYSFNETSSVVRTEDAEEDAEFVRWYLFDYFHPDFVSRPFLARYEELLRLESDGELPNGAVVVRQEWLSTLDEFLLLEEEYSDEGFEGIVVRRPDLPYKFGRSAVREGGFLRLTRWIHTEGKILEVYEQMENTNEATINALGLTERSSHAAGKVGKATFGSVLVQCEEFEKPFRAGTGTGLTKARRDYLWSIRKELPGEIAKIKYKKVGVVEVPRMPQFMGIRSKEDME